MPVLGHPSLEESYRSLANQSSDWGQAGWSERGQRWRPCQGDKFCVLRVLWSRGPLLSLSRGGFQLLKAGRALPNIHALFSLGTNKVSAHLFLLSVCVGNGWVVPLHGGARNACEHFCSLSLHVLENISIKHVFQQRLLWFSHIFTLYMLVYIIFIYTMHFLCLYVFEIISVT